MRIKTNGDAIAHEFHKIMGSKSSLNKTASLNKKSEDMSLSKGDTTVALDEKGDKSVSDSDLADLVSGPDESNDDAVISQINESLDNLDDSGLSDDVEDEEDDSLKSPVKSAKQNLFVSPKGVKVMHGLGKIAASLRSKGEGFAADVVEATALSISDDLKKEAAEKKSVISHLEKVASKLDKSGDKFAGDLVRTTIDNIIKK